MGTTTSTISRLKVVLPDLGYDGGADLHTYVRAIYNQFGDNINSRVFFLNDFNNGATVTLAHNLGTRMSHNRFMLYTGSYAIMTPLTGVSTPSINDFAFVDTLTFEDSKVDITNNSGAQRDLIVVLYQDSISPNPLLAKVQTTPPAAPTGYFSIYPKADGKIYRKGSDGIETVVGGGLTPQKIVFADSPVTVKDGTNYLVDTTGGIVTFNVAAGSSALLQFGVKNDGSDFTVNKARVTCATAAIYIPFLGTVGAGEYFEIDAPVEAILFDWDGTRWVASMSGTKDLTTIVSASPTSAGLVDTSAQSFAGVKTFNDGIKLDDAAGQTALNFYASGSVAANGDFTGTVYFTRVGNLVTITSTVLTHGTGSQKGSLAGLIPVGFKPPITHTNLYYSSSTRINSCGVLADGQLITTYLDWAGTLINGTDTASALNISYNIG